MKPGLLALALTFIFLVDTSLAFADDSAIGPMVMAEFPHLVDLGVEWKINNHWSIGGTAGNVVPLGTIYSVQVGVTNFEFNGQWHPFGGAFFLGMLFGSQNLSASADPLIPVPNVGNVGTSVALQIKSTYFTPHLGWVWGKKGFVFGIEGGIQIPSAAKNNTSTFSVNIDDPTYNQYLTQVKATPEYQKFEASIQNAGDRLGAIVLPYFAIRFGWYF